MRSEVSEIYWNEVTGDWRLTHKSGMCTNRVGFASCFARDKRYIMVSGGFNSHGDQKNDSVEVYNIAEDKWTLASSQSTLKVARSAHSMCEVAGGAYIYVFGGQDQEHR